MSASLSFPGGAGVIDVGSRPEHAIARDLTLEAWIKVRRQRRWAGVISKVFDTGSTESGYGMHLDGDSGVLFGLKVDGQGLCRLSSGVGTITLDVWHHVAMSYDGRSMAIYVDGTRVATRELVADALDHTPSNALRLGAYRDDNEAYGFDGQLSEVRLWSRCRSAEEIARDRGHRLSGHEAGLVSDWPLDEGTGTTAHDHGPAKHDGTIENGEWVPDPLLRLEASGSGEHWALMVYVTPSAGRGIPGDDQAAYDGDLLTAPEVMAKIHEALARLEPAPGTRVSIAVERADALTTEARVLGDRRGDRFLLVEGTWSERRVERDVPLWGLASFLVWTRRALAREEVEPTKTILVVLGDLLEEEQPDADGDSKTRPQTLVDAPSNLGVPRILGTEPRARVFARARMLADALAAARAFLRLPASQWVVDLLATDDPMPSYFEVAFELRRDVGRLLATQITPPRALGPLGGIVSWLGGNGSLLDAYRDDADGLVQRCTESLRARDDPSTATEEWQQALCQAVVDRGYSTAVARSEATVALARALDDFGTKATLALERATPSERRRIHAVSTGMASVAESSCDLHVLARTMSEPQSVTGYQPPRGLASAAQQLQALLEQEGPCIGSHAHLHGRTIYLPVSAELGPSPEYEALELVQDTDERGAGGWRRMLTVLSMASVSPTRARDPTSSGARERMPHEIAALVLPRTPWGLLLYLAGAGPEPVVERTRADYETILEACHDPGLQHLRLAMLADFPDVPSGGESKAGGHRVAFGGRDPIVCDAVVEERRTLDSGRAAELTQFLVWGASQCPAQRLVLVVGGHAVAGEPEGPFTLCHDASSGSSLTVTEFRSALREGLDQLGRDALDVLLLDTAGGLTLELAHELRTVARVIIGRTSDSGPVDYGRLLAELDTRLDPVRLAQRYRAWDRAWDRAWNEQSEQAWDAHLFEAVRQEVLGPELAMWEPETIERLSIRLDVLCRLLMCHLEEPWVWGALLAALSDQRLDLGTFLERLRQKLQAATSSSAAASSTLRDIVGAIARIEELLGSRGLAIYCPMTAGAQNHPDYLALEFHQQVGLYALLGAVRVLTTSTPHQLWGMISIAIAHARGSARAELLERLTAEYPPAPEPEPEPTQPERAWPWRFASRLPLPFITLSIEPDHGRVRSDRDHGEHYRVRLTSTRASTLLQGQRQVNPQSFQDTIASFERLLQSGYVGQAQWSDLQLLGESLGEDIVRELTDVLDRLRADLALDDSPGHDVHLRLEVPPSLMRYPWELMSDGHGMLAERFAIGRQVWPSRRSARPPSRRGDDALRVLIIGVPRALPPTEHRELPGARAEAEAVADVFTALSHDLGPAVDFDRERDVLVDTVVTRGTMRQLLRDRSYDIVHFAGHAELDQEHPGRSAWLLSDGPLWADELRNTLAWAESPPWLIYASACETANGQAEDAAPYAGDVYELAQACVDQGVGSYIAPLWPIGDELRTLVATTFHRALILGRSTPGGAMLQARREAKAWCRDHGGTNGAHVLSWASLVVYGEPDHR